jgi:hypothetical protein
MIELQTRFSYIGRISAIILNQDEIRSVWINKKSGITSVTDFDELYEQLFDDLDIEELERGQSDLLIIDVLSRNEILNFLSAVRDVDKAIESDSLLRNPSDLLTSEAWKKFEGACEKALEIPAVQEAMRE